MYPHHTHHVQTQVKIKNSNFFPVSVNVLNVTLSSLLTQVGLISYPPFSVKMRTTKTVSERRKGARLEIIVNYPTAVFKTLMPLAIT